MFLLCAAGVMVPVALFWGDRPVTVPLVGTSVTTAVLLTFVPVGLALVFSAGHGGRQGVVRLLTRLRPTRRIGPGWYALGVLLHPALQFVAYLFAVWLGRDYERGTPPATLVLIVPALVLAAAEEIGWTGYATAPLQRRWGPLGAALILGTVAAGIHLVPYVQAGHSETWILGQIAVTIGSRVVMIWVFNHTEGSIVPAVLLHATYNTAYVMYPYQGSHYDPVLLAGVLWTFCAIAPLPWAWRNHVHTRQRRGDPAAPTA